MTDTDQGGNRDPAPDREERRCEVQARVHDELDAHRRQQQLSREAHARRAVQLQRGPEPNRTHGAEPEVEQSAGPERALGIGCVAQQQLASAPEDHRAREHRHGDESLAVAVPEHLERALGELPRLHPALGLRFRRERDAWSQSLSDDPPPIPLRRVDMSGMDAQARVAAVRRGRPGAGKGRSRGDSAPHNSGGHHDTGDHRNSGGHPDRGHGRGPSHRHWREW